MSLVLDSSATLAWIFGDETTDAIRGVFDRVVSSGAFVPSLWRLEVANSLTVAVRRNRIDSTFRQSALADLAELDITADRNTDSQAWTNTLQLADRDLRAAAEASGVILLGLPWPSRPPPYRSPSAVEGPPTQMSCTTERRRLNFIL